MEKKTMRSVTMLTLVAAALAGGVVLTGPAHAVTGGQTTTVQATRDYSAIALNSAQWDAHERRIDDGAGSGRRPPLRSPRYPDRPKRTA